MADIGLYISKIFQTYYKVQKKLKDFFINNFYKITSKYIESMINQKRDPNLPSYFVSKLITRMNHFYQLKQQENHFLFRTYDRTDTKIQFDIKK